MAISVSPPSVWNSDTLILPRSSPSLFILSIQNNMELQGNTIWNRLDLSPSQGSITSWFDYITKCLYILFPHLQKKDKNVCLIGLVKGLKRSWHTGGIQKKNDLFGFYFHYHATHLFLWLLHF